MGTGITAAIKVRTNQLIEIWCKIICFVMVQISVLGFVIPKVIYSYFVYFTTDRSEAFVLPLPMWWVYWSPELCKGFGIWLSFKTTSFPEQVSIQLEKSNRLLHRGNNTISGHFEFTSVFHMLGVYGIWCIYVCQIIDAGCSKCFSHHRGKYSDEKFAIKDFQAHHWCHFCACIWKRVEYQIGKTNQSTR